MNLWLKPFDSTPGQWWPKDTAAVQAQDWANTLEVPVLIMEPQAALGGALVPCGCKEPEE